MTEIDKPEAVRLTRAQYEELIERVEDAEDLAAIARIEAREAVLGVEAAQADYLPIELVERLIAGEYPVRVWRAHRGLTREAPAAAAGAATRKKPGSVDALAKLAAALRVSLGDIAHWVNSERRPKG